MGETIDANGPDVLPMSKSPRSVSPFTRTDSPADAVLETPTRAPSSLRNDTTPETVKELPMPRTSAISRSPATSSSRFIPLIEEPNEFPFQKAQSPAEYTSNAANGIPRHDGASDAIASKPPSLAPPSRKATNNSDMEMSGGRKSVQFGRTSTFDANPSHSRQQSTDVADNGDRTQTLFSKLKALAMPPSFQGHTRTGSGLDGTQVTSTPMSERDEPTYDTGYGYGSEADAEESGAEGSSQPRRKRRTRRWIQDGTQTAPTTPKAGRLPSFLRDRDSPADTPTSATATSRPNFLGRRATMTDIAEGGRGGVSEDEGRERLAKESAWRHAMNSARGLSHSGRREDGQTTPGGERRPNHFRRLTALGGAAGAEPSPNAWRFRSGQRGTSLSAQKWKQLKAAMTIGKKTKVENKVDQKKSAELMAELLAGAPAALFLASMFQRDEHGHKRLPILLEQLKIRISDSSRDEDKGGDRVINFRIELEYGSGMTRMKWVINRRLNDFVTLHTKFKYHIGLDKFKGTKATSKTVLPRFPRSAFPYLRTFRGLNDDEDDENEEETAAVSGPEGEASGTERPPRPRNRSSFNIRRKPSMTSPPTPGHLTASGSNRAGSFLGILGGKKDAPAAEKSNDTYAEKQRRKLEQYLEKLIAFFIFRPDSNRLCKFLELSALGVRLAAEGGYHGKEGLMLIQSGKGIDFRRTRNLSSVKNRHRFKWFLVRHSYVVCVDSPEEMNVYDVFLVDPSFKLDADKKRLRDSNPHELASKAKVATTHPKHHRIKLQNQERKLKLFAKNERIQQQFVESIQFMVSQTEWAKEHRFGSFAPVRRNVFAQWLVDGRDYMWNVSRAISMAKDVIYIHDWWLSPELYLRRPAAISHKWRLDRLLQRKAQEGVKIFVILYRNIETAIPIDSQYSKFALLDLHPNICVQRSPNHLRQNTFFWAHHEKVCVIDHTIAFCGGIDLCFGRWDTAQHSIVDDKLTGFEINDMPKDADHCQLWPGKDYSNPRVLDFHTLDKPYEEMYDRSKVPRMPWHDIHMQIVGQPARDLSRHFIQRWNYVLRQRKPTRPTPILLPPPDFVPADLEALGLDGTCEVQILRSSSSWSMGTPDTVEDSIMQAYVKMIQTSDHFVYIENQFYISSCDVDGAKMENLIGDALIERIKRAHRDDEDWRCVLMIPLMPGFQNTVDSQDGSSIRLIMTCQYRSICRGETSLFGRLRAAGIEPEDYIQFYGLRSWGKIGPDQALVTEQLYIHAKCMVVDDRIAIIGSANINERSMLGSRDSEIAAIVRDTDMIPSIMAGEPYMVGRFPHTLRMRLMREHLGIDVDELMEDEYHEEQWDREQEDASASSVPSSPISTTETEQKLMNTKHRIQDELIAKAENVVSFNHDAAEEQRDNPHIMTSKKKVTSDSRVTGTMRHQKDVQGEGADGMLKVMERPEYLGRDSELTDTGREVLLSSVAPEGRPTGEIQAPEAKKKNRNRSSTVRSAITSSSNRTVEGNFNLPPPRLPRMDTEGLGLPHLSQVPALPRTDDTDIGGPPLEDTFSAASARILSPLLNEMRRPLVHPDCMRDPVSDSFYLDTWHTIAENNTKLFRQVFRCQPDNEVRSWKEYKEYAAFSERFNQAQGAGKSSTRRQQENPGKTGPPGADSTRLSSLGGNEAKKVEAIGEKLNAKMHDKDSNAQQGTVSEWAHDQEKHTQEQDAEEARRSASKDQSAVDPNDEKAALRPADSSETAPFPPAPPVPSDDTNLPTRARTVTISEPPKSMSTPPSSAPNAAPSSTSGSQRRRRRAATTRSMRAFNSRDDDHLLGKADAEEVLKLVQGHIVLWPYDWLEWEEKGSGWLYAVDQIAPLEIYC